MRRARLAWCLFDWANSPFPTVVITFVFSAYFARGIVGDPVQGTALWGGALATGGLVVALLGPFLGAAADAAGRRKPWLLGCSALTVSGAFLMWFAAPDPAFTYWALGCVVLANIGFDLGMVFYNAMLPEVAGAGKLGRLSGWGWALGYAGGLACLLIVLFGFVEASPAPFGLDREAAEQVRIAAPFAGLWFALFGWPLFVFVREPETPPLPFTASLAAGFAMLRDTLRHLREYAVVARFLAARLLYIDGLNTIFAFGGIYAAGVFGMSVGRVIVFGIVLNVSAGLGALAFSWVDDAIGAKRTLVMALVGLSASAFAALLAPAEPWFWAAAVVLGIFVGPTQAASRSMMARLAPPERRGEMFGLFALSGKVTAFAGPAMVAWTTAAAQSQRVGMATVLVLMLAGLAILLTLPDPDRPRAG